VFYLITYYTLRGKYSSFFYAPSIIIVQNTKRLEDEFQRIEDNVELNKYIIYTVRFYKIERIVTIVSNLNVNIRHIK